MILQLKNKKLNYKTLCCSEHQEQMDSLFLYTINFSELCPFQFNLCFKNIEPISALLMAVKMVLTLWTFIPSSYFHFFQNDTNFLFSQFFFFPWTSQSRGSYFLLPLELIYFIDCCMVSSWEFLSFIFFSSKWSDVSLILCLTFFVCLFGFTSSLDGAQLQILPESGFGKNNSSSPWMS